MYGLKPVPFKLKPVPFKLKPVPFKLKPVPFKGRDTQDYFNKLLEPFSNSCALFSSVQGGFFLRKSHLSSCFRCTAIGEHLSSSSGGSKSIATFPSSRAGRA